MGRFADAHDYEFRAIQRDDCERKGGWIKIEPIMATLVAQFDYLLWMDIDALVVRKDVDIREELSQGADLQMVWHGADTCRLEVDSFIPHFNSGVMLIRNTPWARRFFARVWETGPVSHPWNDQATILHLLGFDGLLGLGSDEPKNPGRNHIARLDSRWNSIVGVAVAMDPIVHHYAGMGSSARLRLMQADQRTLKVREAADPEVREAGSSGNGAPMPFGRRLRPGVAGSNVWDFKTPLPHTLIASAAPQTIPKLDFVQNSSGIWIC